MTGIKIFQRDIFSKCTTAAGGGSEGQLDSEAAAAASGGGGSGGGGALPRCGIAGAAPPPARSCSARETRTCNSRDETRGLHHKTTYTNMSCLSTRNSKCVIVLIIVIILTIANNAACVSAISLDQVVNLFTA